MLSTEFAILLALFFAPVAIATAAHGPALVDAFTTHVAAEVVAKVGDTCGAEGGGQ